MNIEIETKVKVESLEETADRLDALGGDFQGGLSQRDTFFSDAENTLIKSGCGLRIRREKNDNTEKIILTYKGPKQKGPFKSRQEIEVRLNDFTAMVDLLAALGYNKIIVFEKRRQLWKFDGCLVCLDELPLLGNFVEIEGPDENMIAGVVEKLQIGNLPHINAGYARLMKDKLDELGSDKKEIFFDSAQT